MRNFALACAAAGALGLAATATPTSAASPAGLKAPAVESNKVDARCWHRRNRSKWRCTRGYHKRWESRRHWNRGYYRNHYYSPYYYPFPFSLFRL